MLFGHKNEEVAAKPLSSKSKSKELFKIIKQQGAHKGGMRRQPFRKTPYLKTSEEIEECSHQQQNLFSLYEKRVVRISSFSYLKDSPHLLSPMEYH